MNNTLAQTKLKFKVSWGYAPMDEWFIPVVGIDLTWHRYGYNEIWHISRISLLKPMLGIYLWNVLIQIGWHQVW